MNFSFRLILALLVIARVAAADDPAPSGPRALVERAIAAHGGEIWLNPRTLILKGQADFFSRDSREIRSHADDYRMWRVMDESRDSAHEAHGKVRIIARSEGRLLFEIGYDGETTWTERGILPKTEAGAFWASNFGFGIIRSALRDGFTLESAPMREVSGHKVDLLRVIDPSGSATLFGIDRESGFIRYLSFDTPRGFHERIYDDFVRLENGWVQARRVTLLYDGVPSNSVTWEDIEIGKDIDASIFTPPARED